MKHVKRKLMSLLLVMAMAATMVPTALASYSDIELYTDATSTFDFYEDDNYGDSVYSEIKRILRSEGYTDFEDYYVVFDEDYGYNELVDSEYEYSLNDLNDIWLDIGNDDKWEGSYEVYDWYNNDRLILDGYITVYFDEYRYDYGDEDIELSTDEWDTFYFDDDNTDEGDSVYDVITDLLYSYDRNYTGDYYVKFTEDRGSDATLSADRGYNYSNVDLEDLDRIYLDIDEDAEEWSGTYKVYDDSDGSFVFSGNIYIYFGGYGSGASVGDITYTAEVGDEVELNVDDFDDFWYDYTDGKGALKSVKFTTVNSGTLCYEHTGSERSHTSAKNKTYYVSPSRTQDGLDDLTFFPTKSGSKYPTGAVTIGFTATGTTKSGSNTTKSASGKITILYTVGDVSDINVSAIGSIMLNGSDFDKVYKDVVGGTSPTYTIQFKSLPLNGTLYYNAAGTSKGTELTSRNLTTRFSNKSNGTNSISKVKYVPGTRGGDTVEYAVYANNKLQYVGKLNFNVQTTVPDVYYSCTTGSVSFKAIDFFNNSNSSIYVFGKPASGALYTNYGTSAQAEVTSYTRFALTANPAAGIYGISDITYVPAPGYSGTVSVEFAGNALTGGGTVSGSVKITVVPVKDFTDVPKSNWAYNYIMRLTSAGIVGGQTPTTFAPGSNLKYGEALKMILGAVGYPDQAKTGTHWASGYLTLAQQKGIVTETKVDLEQYVDRNTVAALTARALGLSKAASVNAGIAKPTDSTDGYVYALYNAGIMNGDSSSGVNRYNGTKRITRAEIAKIVCVVMDYKGR